MTKDHFLQRHGEHWEAFKRDPMFTDLLSVLEEYSPHRTSMGISPQEGTQNAPYLLGTISGFHLAVGIIEKALSLQQKIEPPTATYAEENQ